MNKQNKICIFCNQKMSNRTFFDPRISDEILFEYYCSGDKSHEIFSFIVKHPKSQFLYSIRIGHSFIAYEGFDFSFENGNFKVKLKLPDRKYDTMLNYIKKFNGNLEFI